MVTRGFRVTGKVQGVCFRHSARIEAERLAVRGVARNLRDGSVEVIAHGEPAAVEALREWLNRGPAMARVAGVREIAVNVAEGQQADGRDGGAGPHESTAAVCAAFRVE